MSCVKSVSYIMVLSYYHLEDYQSRKIITKFSFFNDYISSCTRKGSDTDPQG